jgi:hypothetical protein
VPPLKIAQSLPKDSLARVMISSLCAALLSSVISLSGASLKKLPLGKSSRAIDPALVCSWLPGPSAIPAATWLKGKTLEARACT